MDGDNSGYYTVTYTNETGCKSYKRIKMVVDDPDKPFVDTLKIDTGITAIGRDYRNGRNLRLERKPMYFDLLGNRLKSKPRNSVYVER